MIQPVVVLFAVFGALLGACGLGLAATGVVMLVEGNEAGVVGVCGLLICYGGYLFGRAAGRVRRDLHEHPLSEQQQRSRKRSVGLFLGSTLTLIVGAATLPGPTIVHVVMVVTALLLLPLMLAREFEPPKKHKPSDG
jgi:hypothetical protein